MVRSELVQKITQDHPHLDRHAITRIVATILNEIIEALSRGERVELRGFGSFGVRKHDSRMRRNPRTGETFQAGETCVPYFKTGKDLRERLNGS